MRINSLVSLVVAATLSTAAAHAADWAGPYVGANFGFGFGAWDASESGATFVDSITTRVLTLKQSIDMSGALGGIQGGYLWQFGVWAVGVEADADLASISGTTTATQRDAENTGSIFTFPQPLKATADWLVTLRGRAGLAADRFLYYGTLGLAGAQLSYQSAALFSFPSVTTSDTLWGLAAGGGVEYAAAQSVSLRLEYLYVRLPDFTASYALAQGIPVGTSTATNTFRIADPSLHIVRVGLNWRF